VYRKRFGLCVLNYQVTYNHVHLLTVDRGADEIANSMQLIAGAWGAPTTAANGAGDRQVLCDLFGTVKPWSPDPLSQSSWWPLPWPR
jgi:hypothetical protein